LWSPNYRITRTSYEFAYLYLGDLCISLQRVLAFVTALIVTGVVYFLLSRTDLGKAIRAASEEPRGALLMGINVRKIYWITFGIGAACAGVAGSVTAPFFPTYPTVGSIFVITAFMVVVLGGMGSVLGAFVGGLIIGVADAIGGMIFPGSMKSMISFVLFILILLFKPMGLFGSKH